MKRLPIKAARHVAVEYDLSQVILAAWDGERTHIVTYGRGVEDCAQAAMGGNKIKAALGWPKDLNAEPPRVAVLLEKLARIRLAAENARVCAEDAHVLPEEVLAILGAQP